MTEHTFGGQVDAGGRLVDTFFPSKSVTSRVRKIYIHTCRSEHYSTKPKKVSAKASTKRPPVHQPKKRPPSPKSVHLSTKHTFDQNTPKTVTQTHHQRKPQPMPRHIGHRPKKLNKRARRRAAINRARRGTQPARPKAET